MKPEGRIGARLTRTFALQGAFVSLAAVIGVFIAGVLLEGPLIRQALRGEADYFWERRGARADFPLPATRNLSGYLQDAPAAVAGLPSGFHPWRQGKTQYVVYVSERAGQRLYLVFDRTNVDRLAIYYGLAPLAVLLLVLYLSTWLGYRATRRELSPILALARRVRQLDLAAPDPAAFAPESVAGRDDEIRELATALVRLTQRVKDLLERERNFTRDASHELRTPLTVIRMSAERLQQAPGLDEPGRRAVARIVRAAVEMEDLTNALLLLARETETGLPTELVSITDVVAREMEKLQPIVQGRPVQLETEAHRDLLVEAPEKVIEVLLGNLLRNAASYTEQGSVRVTIDRDGVVVEDTGVGIAPDRLDELSQPFVRGASRRPGFGVGLAIVRRISDRFGWPVEFESEVGRGTRVRVRFPEATTPADGGA